MATSGDDSTFGKSLMKFITNRLPYQSYASLTPTEELNPKYKDFADKGSKRIEALQRQSISSSTLYNNTPIPGLIDSYKDAFFYANLQQDKASRLGDYRVMAAFSEVSNCLDQICDEIINKDADGNIVKLHIKNKRKEFTETENKVLNEQFERYIQYFDLEYSGWEYFRQLLIEGEIYFEHVIHKDYADKGILGVLKIPTELIDPIFGNVQNHMVKGYLLRKPIFDPKNPQKVEKFEFIPMDVNQVTYINSGIWNENKTIRLPFIENARRAYRQLSLIEDSIVIYRLVRAPERLVFNVDTGNLPAPQAESYLKKLQQMYWKKFSYDPQGGGTVTKFSPQSMLDSFWFAKRQGSEGTTVTTLPAGCLAMDTMVPLLDGRELTISQLADEYKSGKTNWVYSCDPQTGKVMPGIISWAGVTQESAKVMRLTFDNGKSIVCTLDHKFPIIGKGFVEAKDLKIGESMIPFTKNYGKLGKYDYEQIYQNDSKTWEYTHRMVTNNLKNDIVCESYFDESYKDAIKDTIHHKDFNRFNNDPNNLTICNSEDHFKYHSSIGFKPMIGTIAAKQKMEYLKKHDPNTYKQLTEKRVQTLKETVKNWSKTKRKVVSDKIRGGIKQYIENLSNTDRELRAQNSRRARKIANNKLQELRSNPANKEKFEEIYKKISDKNTVIFNTPEYKKLRSEQNKKMWEDQTRRQKHIENNKRRWNNSEERAAMVHNMSLHYTTEALRKLIDVINTTNIFKQKDLVKYLNNNKNEFYTQFVRDNPNQNIWGGVINLNTLKNLVRAHGYKNYAAFRREYSMFNHRIVSIEYLEQPIQVGTLTIDADEKYHNYHTFALSCGVFTKNSNLGELDDLMYFVKKLYESLKVPVTRLNPEDAYKDGLDILREELKFANFLIRQQQRFATGLKNGFITHLKLMKLWDTIGLKETDIDIEFNVPTNFYEMRAQQKLELKLNNFGTATSSDFVSKLYGMKKYLGWSDEDIKANREFLRKDRELLWELEQITQGGPNWRATYTAAAQQQAQGAAPGGGSPPGFGPTPGGLGGGLGADGESGLEGGEGGEAVPTAPGAAPAAPAAPQTPTPGAAPPPKV